MKYEKQARALVRKMIRRARQDWTTCIYVTPYGENGVLNDSQLERDIIDSVFSCEETMITFYDMTTGRNHGKALIVLEYDSEPSEIISDYIDSPYMQRLIEHIGV